MRRPWKVPFRKNRKLQSCLALSLALHLLVIFGIMPRERVTQYPVLPQIMLKFTKRPPPQRTLTRRQRPRERPLVRRPALQAAPVAAVRSLIRASFQAMGYQEWKDWKFTRLEIIHPIYNCFYDVRSLPRGMRDMHYAVAVPLTPDYLEGIVVGEQLVGVYSMKGYAYFWSGIAEQEWEAFDVANSPFLASAEESLVYNLGLNIVVYALTREGSLARQLVDAD